MKKLLLSLIYLLTYGLPALATIWTAPITKSDLDAIGKNSTNIASISDVKVSLNNLDWIFSVNGEGSNQWNKQFNNGYVFGSKNNPISSLSLYTTGLSDKKITKITLDIGGSSTNAAYEVETVCGSFSKTETASGSDNNSYTYSPSVTGSPIAFNIKSTNTGTANKTGVKITKIEIEYSDDEIVTKTPVELYWPDFDNGEISLSVGENVLLNATSNHEDLLNFIDDITYTSENPDVAEVDENNYLIAKTSGTTTVTAAIPDSHATYSSNSLVLNVTVTESGPTQVAIPAATVNGKILEDNDEIFVNDAIELSCATEDAIIKYSFVSDGEMTIYDGTPIILNKEDIYTLYLEASKEGLESSKLEITFLVSKRQAELSYSADNVVAYLDAADEFIVPSLYNPASLPVTFSSMEESVATIDETTGHITLMGEGETMISAVFNGNQEYENAEAFYILEVRGNKPAVTTSSVTFNFEKNEYGMTRYSGTTTNYNEDVTEIFNDKDIKLVKITATNGENGKNRLWTDGWRFHRGSKITGTSNYNSCEYTFEVSMDNYMISEVSFTGKLADSGKATISAEGYDADSKVWKGKAASIPFKISTSDNMPIATVTVTFEHDIVKMPELFGQDGKLGLSHSDGHEIYYKVVAENSQMRTVNRDPAYDDNFQLYTEPFILRDGETIYAYAQHPHGMVSEILAKTYADIATGVENIASDDAEGDVKYFNLQGVEVENPADGIYIRIANGKAEKVIK